MDHRHVLDSLTLQAVNARRALLSEHLHGRFQGAVAYGPLKGFAIDLKQVWGGLGELGGKLVGFYEREVLDTIFRPGRPRWRCLVNIGAGDGYYAVGLLKAGAVPMSLCFEADEHARASIAGCAALNGVANRVAIHGRADSGFLHSEAVRGLALADCLFIVDIEGGEFSLFNDEALALLRHSELIIELHGGFFPDHPNIGNAFVQRLNEVFHCRLLTTTARDPSTIPELNNMNDMDRWLICAEGRPHLMRWVHCLPREPQPRPSPSLSA